MDIRLHVDRSILAAVDDCVPQGLDEDTKQAIAAAVLGVAESHLKAAVEAFSVTGNMATLYVPLGRSGCIEVLP